MGESCAKTGWQVLAYCLMGNHFHLVVETPEPNLVGGMKWFLGTYTGRFNRRQDLKGQFLLLMNANRMAMVPAMARKLRVEYAGAIYHVMNCGNRREPIFRDDKDREIF